MIGGKEIIKQVDLGNITIYPFDPKQAGPNSYDLRLAYAMARVKGNSFFSIDTHKPSKIKHKKMTKDGGFWLWPFCVYLSHTIEYVGSNYYVPLLHGRSSMARHGGMVHLTAGFGDIGWFGKYVLEMRNMNLLPMKVYPGDRICQVEWERVEGEYETYNSTYQNQEGIVPAKGLQD